MSNILPFPKAVLFDFDGVIVDSFRTHYKGWCDAFQELFNKQPPPFPHDTHAGKAPIIISEYFCESVGKKERAKELFELKTYYLHNNTTPPDLLPGVKQIQSYLKSKNIPYGIASNATRGFVQNSVNSLNLDVSTIFGVEDYTKPKPNPEPYLTLAKALNISTNDFENVWIFEDSLTGTIAAKNAGMIPIGIGTQYTDEELKNAGSKIVFPTLLEAYYYLNK